MPHGGFLLGSGRMRNRIAAVGLSGRYTTRLAEDWGTAQQSKQSNTDFTEKKIQPQIYSEKGGVTRVTSCVCSWIDLDILCINLWLNLLLGEICVRILLAVFAARFRTDEQRTIKPVSVRFKFD